MDKVVFIEFFSQSCYSAPQRAATAKAKFCCHLCYHNAIWQIFYAFLKVGQYLLVANILSLVSEKFLQHPLEYSCFPPQGVSCYAGSWYLFW